MNCFMCGDESYLADPVDLCKKHWLEWWLEDYINADIFTEDDLELLVAQME